MKDAYTVLLQKERDAKRVRKEVEALLTVIPLLKEDDHSSDIAEEMVLHEGPKTQKRDTSILELERYYPFIRHLHR